LKKLGIIAALPAEAKCFQTKKINFKSPFEIKKNVFLCISGIGYKSSHDATKELLKLNIDALISWGIAGATCDLVTTGDLILARSVRNHKKIYYTTDEWCKKIIHHFQDSSHKLLYKDIVSTDEICATPVEKIKLFKKTKALAIDMESAAIAEVAIKNNLDFIAIRVISDNVTQSIPEIVIKNIDNYGYIDILKLIKFCMFNPSQINQILLLAKSYKKALKSLENFSIELKKENFFYLI
tara:strand:- start:1344 stop:2060 length:717 start_codon:yes stop_codon:yes gene_type:complete